MMKPLKLKNKPKLADFIWPQSKLGEAIETLALYSHFLPPKLKTPPLPTNTPNEEHLEQWIEQVAVHLNLEAEAVTTTYAKIDSFIQSVAPAILRLPLKTAKQQTGFLIILKSNWQTVTLISPKLSTQRFACKLIKETLCHPLEAPLLPQINQLLTQANISKRRWQRCKASILEQMLGSTSINGCWILRLLPGTYTWGQIRFARLPQMFLVISGMYIIAQILSIIGWWIVGGNILNGNLPLVWFIAWGLISLTAIPIQLLSTWGQGVFTTNAGVLFKQRLLYGSLQLNPEDIRHQGAGQFFGRVIESQAVEALGVGGGIRAIQAIFQLGLATVVLALSGNGLLYIGLLISWISIALLISLYYLHRTNVFITAYRTMTNSLIERMIGHRTRLTQEDKTQWHTEEDTALANYLHLSRRLDQVGILLTAIMPRGWFLISFAGLAYLLLFKSISLTQIAITLGGILLAAQSISEIINGIQSWINLIIAWQEIKPLYNAATHKKDTTTATEGSIALAEINNQQKTQTLLAMHRLSFSYPNQIRSVLKKCYLQINQGDRLLLQGPSGSGKSTLVMLLSGLYKPRTGLLLLNGLDQQTVGSQAWRKKIVIVPQFHQNHIITETMSFNLLMGRNWPPTIQDIEEAEAICREIGLGELLDRMPAGLQQIVGESGWQLSHGERSRLYIARALLQNADLIILDENFSALDPENLQQSFQCVLNHANTLLVIAHP